MGNKQGHHHHGQRSQRTQKSEQPQSTPQQQTQAEQGRGGEKTKEEPVQAVPSQTYDVVIAATPADAELVGFIKAQLESTSLRVYWNAAETDEAAKLVGKVLVDTKLLIFVVSEAAAQNNRCQDQVSLAYISNKPIFIAAKQGKASLIKNFQVGMKLTLQSLLWTVFDKEEEKEMVGRQFVQLVQEQLTKTTTPAAQLWFW